MLNLSISILPLMMNFLVKLGITEYINVTYLHETSLMSQFLHVEFNIPLCRVQSVLHISENQKSILLFYPKLWNFENSENIKS